MTMSSSRISYGADIEVSIVVPTLDVTSAAVGECLRNVKATVRVPHELIVIDNGAPPQGVSAPVNAGFRAARGRHLVLLNDDVQVLEGWWEPLAQALDGGADVAFPTTVNGKMGRFPAWCFAMCRDTLERFAHAPGEFLDPTLTIWCWDTDLWLRLCEADSPPVHVPESRVSHDFHRTADLHHVDDGYRKWLHAQFVKDHAVLRVKHPGYRPTPRRAKSPDLVPTPLIAAPVAVRVTGTGWYSQTLPWPKEIGYFLIEGEVELNVSPEDIEMQLIFTDDQNADLFSFSLTPGPVQTRLGSYFLLERERALVVSQEDNDARPDPEWSTVTKLVVRCASENHSATATITRLRAFARIGQITAAPT
jgi:CTP:molybdopterin cytidylyltransferase MocA